MDATFLMTNMVPQAADLNRGPWSKLETYCRDQARDGEKDLYIVAGPAGSRSSLRRGSITVPRRCWKVVLVVPAGSADPGKLTAEEARVFAAVMPNEQGLDADWRGYAVPVKDVEKLTGYSFFTSLPRDVAEELRSRDPQTRERASKPMVKEATKKEATKKEAKGKGLELTKYEKGCVVGNRQSKVYHLPGGQYYDKAKESKNAAFFRTEEDAKEAGYRASKR